MTKTHVVVLRSAPSSPQADSAIDLAQGLLERGGGVTVALVQDAVLVALGGGALAAQQKLRRLLDMGGGCQYLAQDLALRGFGPHQTLDSCVPTDYAGLVELLLADGARVSGAF